MNTPDTEWEKDYDAMVEDARLYSDFPDMLVEHIKGYVRKERTSRDTYWKERVRKEKTDLLDEMLEYTHLGYQFIDGVRELIEAREIKKQAITNEDNLK